MPYAYDPKTQLMVNTENPGIHLEYRGHGREVPGERYLLTWGPMRIGLSNADGKGDEYFDEILPEGGRVFHLNQIGIPLYGFDRPWPKITNFVGFESEEQQDQFLEILFEVFEVFDGHFKRMCEGKGNGKLVITEGLKREINEGHFLRDSPAMRKKIGQEKEARQTADVMAKKLLRAFFPGEDQTKR